MMRFGRSHAPRCTFRQPPGRENARAQVEYAAVNATLAQKTEKAILLTTDALHAWVPLHKLDAASRVAVYRAARGDAVTVHVDLKFALEEKLV